MRLTPRAEKLVTGLAPHLIKLNDIVFGGLSRRDFRELSRIAAQLTANSARALSFYLEEKFAGRRLIDRGLDRALKVLA